MKRDEGRGARDEWRRLIVWSWEVIGSYQLKRDEGRMAKVIRVVMGSLRHLPIETGRGTCDEGRMTMVIHKFVKRHQYFLKYRNQRISQYYSSSHAPRPSSLGHGLAPRNYFPRPSSHAPRPSSPVPRSRSRSSQLLPSPLVPRPTSLGHGLAPRNYFPRPSSLPFPIFATP